ncbi:MAG: hypothetical protein E6R03_11360 [Hyphomicrobiaceae bacterium]|nr:MAG: hypothetical protein E6R03_11360 [Hyphomicrobiaceae bacterium]
MWIIRVQVPGEECPLVYTGSDMSSQVLFETFKARWPDALFTLESMLSGNHYVPHDGDSYPFWFLSSGLTNRHHAKWDTQDEDEIL